MCQATQSAVFDSCYFEFAGSLGMGFVAGGANAVVVGVEGGIEGGADGYGGALEWFDRHAIRIWCF